MIRLILTALALLFVIVFEHGFLGALDGALALVPLSVAVGVYFALHLRPAIGLAWLAASGLALDIHEPYGAINVLWLTLLGWLLIFTLSQYVTHRSYYAVAILSAGYFLAWGAVRVLIRSLQSDVPAISSMLHDMLDVTILGSLTVLLITLAVAYFGKRLAPFIRIRL